jgi:hypothetical protein
VDERPPEETVARLPSNYVPAEPSPRRPGRLHGLATIAMAGSAIIGIGAMLAFITIGWPGESGRYVIGVVIFSAVTFIASALIAVFAAARDTYPSRSTPLEGETDDRGHSLQ